MEVAPSSQGAGRRRAVHSFPTRRSSDLGLVLKTCARSTSAWRAIAKVIFACQKGPFSTPTTIKEQASRIVVGVENRSEEHTSELQSRLHLVCRLLLEKKKREGPRLVRAP